MALGISEERRCQRVESGAPAPSARGRLRGWAFAAHAGRALDGGGSRPVGPERCLSHRSAAALWGFVRTDEHGRDRRDRAEPARDGIRRASTAHRHGSLPAARLDRPCVGSPARPWSGRCSILAAVVPMWQLRKALAEAEVLRIVDLDLPCVRCSGAAAVAAGLPGFASILDELHPETRRTRSELERMFLRMCSQGGLPTPEVNVSLRRRRSSAQARLPLARRRPDRRGRQPPLSRHRLGLPARSPARAAPAAGRLACLSLHLGAGRT